VDAKIFEDGEGEVYGAGAGRTRFLAQAPTEPIAITDTTIPPAFKGPVPHRHTTMYDIFYVLDGTLELTVGSETRKLDAHAFALIPPGVVHTFSNPGSTPVRFLNIHDPAGMEQYVKEVGKRMAAGQSPSPSEMAELASQYDFEPVAE